MCFLEVVLNPLGTLSSSSVVSPVPYSNVGSRKTGVPLSFCQVVHLQERFEIVSLVGTLNKEAHLHVCLADKDGRTVGGHVLGDLEVFTTAEVLVGEASDLHFDREMDDRTGYPELVIKPRS